MSSVKGRGMKIVEVSKIAWNVRGQDAREA